MGIQSQEQLIKANGFLEAGKPEEARQILSVALENDLENTKISFAIWCCNYWIDIIKQLDSIREPFERGESLINEWKSFEKDLADRKTTDLNTVFAVRRGVFSKALLNYSKLTDERDPVTKAEICRKTGLCYKKFGEYETAKNCLLEANAAYPGLAPVLAELADCYALCGEDKKAKVLFREAFFINPQKIDLAFLDSELICCLIRQVAEKGYTGAALQEWIPVYGVLFGIFNVKRELRSQEVGRLRQDIYAKENESKDPNSVPSLFTPRLINMYFWLIDYYVMKHEDTAKINQILLKIKILDPVIYTKFVQ
ncbi:MAG: hypothetical protein K6E51_04205 [Treponema sp.]|nr:hypothetical protein [Treponema sp.]